MTDHLSNDDRERLITGDPAGALSADQAAEVSLLAELLADSSTWVEPPADLEDAVVRSVTAAPTAGTQATRIVRGANRDTVRRRHQFLAAAFAAAAVAAAIVVAVIATEGGSTTDYSAQLSATELAPDARATADIARNDAGFRITLDARGLPPLQAGEFYQAWLKSNDGKLVPVGTFSSSDDRVTLWSGVSPNDYPNITVTIEKSDNDQASSGRRVLIGKIHSR